MKSLALILALLMAHGLTMAETLPSYKDARNLYDQLGKPVAASGVWWKKPLPERQQALREADALAKRAESLFGTSRRFAACRSAALAMKTFILDLNDLALVVDGRREIKNAVALFAPSFNAVAFGEHKAFCYEEVEALDTQAKK